MRFLSTATLCLPLLGSWTPARAQTGASFLPAGPVTCAVARSTVLSHVGALSADPDPYRALPFQLSGRSEADALLYRLTDLAQGPPFCPAALALRGIVKAGMTGRGWAPKDAPGQRAGADWREDAVRDLVDASRDTADVSAVAGVIASALLRGTPSLAWLRLSLGAPLMGALKSRGAVADTLREWERGRLALFLSLPSEAESAFVAYSDFGGNAERAALELARLYLAAGNASGATLYYQVAATRSPQIARALETDLALIADSVELAEFRQVVPGQRPGWLRRFWERRDLESLRPRGSRLSEHFHRISEARRRFPILVRPRRYETFELWRNPDADFDDRGLIFIRHGSPDLTAEAAGPDACRNVSWLFRRPGGNLVFHFIARDDPHDWRLAETIFNLGDREGPGGGSGASNRLRREFKEFECASPPELLSSRAAIDPLYARLAVGYSRAVAARELELTTRSRKLGTTSDSHELQFPRVLLGALQVYSLFGDSERGRLLLVSSVRTENLRPRASSSRIHDLAQRVVARAGELAVERDTLWALSFTPAPGTLVTFTTELRLAPARWALGMVLAQGDSVGQFFRDTVTVLQVVAGNLALSDLVLGGPKGHPWSAPDGGFRLSPTGSYVRGDEIAVYYEIAGAAGAELRTEVSIEGPAGRTRLGFAEPGGPGIQRLRRFVDTSELRPGRYELTVQVRSATGAASRTVSLVITAPR